jgi:hypothetical protein
MRKSIFAGLCAAALIAASPAAFAVTLTFNGTGDAIVPESGGVHQVTQVAGGYALVCTAASEPTGEEDAARFVNLVPGVGTSIGAKDFTIDVTFVSPIDTVDPFATDTDTTDGNIVRKYPMRGTSFGADVGSGFGVLVGMTGFPDDDDGDTDPESGTVYVGSVGNLALGANSGRFTNGEAAGAVTHYTKASVILSGTETFGGVAVPEPHNGLTSAGDDTGGLDDSEAGEIHFSRVGDQVGTVIEVGGSFIDNEGFNSADPVGMDTDASGVIDGGEVNTALAGASVTGISFWILQDRADETPAKFANDSGATMAVQVVITFDGPVVSAITSDNELPIEQESLTLTANVEVANGAVTYQWKKDGVDISGETGATLTIPSLAQGDAGDYTVEVTDADGPSDSPEFVLAVGSLGAKDAAFFE